MILCQPSLNDIPFIFPQPVLYKPLISLIPRHTKTPSLLLSWVLVKLSNLVICWSSWDSRYWVRLTLPLLTLLFLHPYDLYQESSPPPYGYCMNVWSLSLTYFLCFHDENLGLKHDSNFLNSLKYVWMFLNVFMCYSHVLGCSSHVHA